MTNGLKLIIFHDDNPINPRCDFFDNLGIMRCFHRRYSLGDPVEMVQERLAGQTAHVNGATYDAADLANDPMLFREWVTQSSDVAAWLPLYLYDHSGIDISTRTEPFWQHAQWDSGLVGFIFIAKADLRKANNCKRVTAKMIEAAKEQLRQEVAYYRAYLNDAIYGFSIRDGEDNVIYNDSGFLSQKDVLATGKKVLVEMGGAHEVSLP